jgi:hypothetical protein
MFRKFESAITSFGNLEGRVSVKWVAEDVGLFDRMTVGEVSVEGSPLGESCEGRKKVDDFSEQPS